MRRAFRNARHLLAAKREVAAVADSTGEVIWPNTVVGEGGGIDVCERENTGHRVQGRTTGELAKDGFCLNALNGESAR
ncbi:hypothetical protein STCU_11709 [Strigomonas culicis]|uniref:Uncharacterized protein n=1 Tax=Strigomonas culicis TaxID=28005 RepID=S9UMD0_9TRYP|nr:hypothetical protein STCU_11709 [Strigomonas culicis]|eukprot:EPY15866.1 hypothetical protein STCU_11709 [Strigomonas culicis]